MATIGKFRKAAADRKRYTVDYSNWMAADENVATVIMWASSNPDGFTVDGYLVGTDLKTANFFVSGGVTDGEYSATITISTDKGQIKQDNIDYIVVA